LAHVYCTKKIKNLLIQEYSRGKRKPEEAGRTLLNKYSLQRLAHSIVAVIVAVIVIHTIIA